MFHVIFSPLTWGLLLAAMLWIFWSRLRRWLRIVGVGLGGLLLLLCTPLGANSLVRYAESRTPAQAYCKSAVTPAASLPVVLLSAGFDRPPDAVDDYAALTPESWRRLRGAIDLWRRSPGTELVIAGGGPFALKESAVLAALAREWGVPVGLLRVETRSTTTWESAMALRAVLPPKIRLVSSALHLPRALVAFQAAGIDACAQANDSEYQPPGGLGYLLPQISAIEKTQIAIYELAGTADYRIRAMRSKRPAKAIEQPHGPT